MMLNAIVEAGSHHNMMSISIPDMYIPHSPPYASFEDNILNNHRRGKLCPAACLIWYLMEGQKESVLLRLSAFSVHFADTLPMR